MTERQLYFGPYHLVTFQDLVEHRPHFPVDDDGNISINALKPPFKTVEQATVRFENDTLDFSLGHRFGFCMIDDVQGKITSQQTDGMRFRLVAGNFWDGTLDTEYELTDTDRDLFRNGIGLYLSFILKRLPDSRKR
jgi:hypothetical protein